MVLVKAESDNVSRSLPLIFLIVASALPMSFSFCSFFHFLTANLLPADNESFFSFVYVLDSAEQNGIQMMTRILVY
jgi:hypothetical protein